MQVLALGLGKLCSLTVDGPQLLMQMGRGFRHKWSERVLLAAGWR